MWRIFGYLFFNDAHYFIVPEQKKFDREKLIEFLSEKGIALYDTACAVRRLKNNASDQFLEIAQYTDVKALLQQMPLCNAIVTTGQKATQTLCTQFDVQVPEVGGCVEAFCADRHITLYRMPSSSRAYPMKIEQKALSYKQMLEELSILSKD